jgi:hypothetical protein
VTRDRVVDKLRKLLAKQASTDSEAEAQAIGECVQRLVREHRVSMTEVEMEEASRGIGVVGVVVDPYDSGVARSTRKTKWFEALAKLCADSYLCRLVNFQGSNKVLLVGFANDVELARGALQYLAMVAEDMSQKAYVCFFHAAKRQGQVELARGYRQGWLTGFCIRLHARFREEDEKARRELSPMALMRLGGALAFDPLDKWIRENLTTKMSKRSILSGDKNPRGVEDGHRAADRVPLRSEKARIAS